VAMALPCRCSVPVAEWIRLQWVLRMKRASSISAVRGSDALFPNDSDEDVTVVCLSVGHTGERCKKADTDRERREPV